MPSSYTTNLGIEKIATGEQSGSWGDTTNTNLDILDEAVNGVISVTLGATGSSGSPTALPITDGASSTGRNKFIEFVDGGDLGGTAFVQLTPNDSEKIVHIRNSLSASRSVIIFQGTYNASNDFEILNGTDVLLKFDGAGSGAVVTNVNINLNVNGLDVDGNVDVSGDLTLSAGADGALTFGAASSVKVVDNNAAALVFEEADTAYMTLVTTNGSEAVKFDKALDVNAAVQVDGIVKVGVDGTGYDFLLFGDTGGKSLLWDQSADSLIVTGTTTLVGTTNLDAVDIDGNVQADGTITVGVNDTGYDVKFFGATSGKSMLWDESADSLIVTGTVDVVGTVTADGLTVDTDGQVIVNHSGTGGGIRIDSTNNTNVGSLRFGDVADNYIGALEYDHSSDSMTMYVNNGVRMTIDSSGNVDVAGTVTSDGLTVAGASALSITNNATYSATAYPNEIFEVRNTSTTAGTDASLAFRADGNGGSAATGAINLIQTANGSGDFAFQNRNAGTLGETFRITSAGKIGIGTAAPALDLHVVGADGVAEGVPSFNADSVAVFQNSGSAGDAAIVHIISGTTGNAFIAFGDKDDSIRQTITANQSDGNLKFATGNAALAMTITSGGNTCLGTITTPMQDFGADRTTLALKGRDATDYSVIQMGNGGTSGNDQLHGQIAFYDVHSSADLRVSAISSYREISTNSSYLSFGTSPGSAGLTEAMRIDRAGAVKIFGDINHVDNGGTSRILYDKSENLLGNTGTNVTCATLSKASGSFKIDHPLESKTDTHHLIHSFVESPTADNIYRGKIALVSGSATVDIDTVAGMTDGTFAALNREVQCFTSNESGWTAVKGSVSGNTLTITAQENTCTDTVSWLVVGERKDPHMYATDWTDENGKVIVEPLKPVIEETEEETP